MRATSATTKAGKGNAAGDIDVPGSCEGEAAGHTIARKRAARKVVAIRRMTYAYRKKIIGEET